MASLVCNLSQHGFQPLHGHPLGPVGATALAHGHHSFAPLHLFVPLRPEQRPPLPPASHHPSCLTSLDLFL